MTKRITVVPAYGRDYKSIAAITADFKDGKDFIVQDFNFGSGMAANIDSLRDLAEQTGERHVFMARYAKLTKQVELSA